jgi:hypothetical protein
MLKSQSFWEKADEPRQQEYGNQNGRCFRTMHRIVTEGIQSGDLPPTEMSREQIVFAIASTAVGSHVMARNPNVAALSGVDNPMKRLCQNVNILLDGLGWKPLTSDYDYDAVDRRIKEQLFPDATWFKE